MHYSGDGDDSGVMVQIWLKQPCYLIYDQVMRGKLMDHRVMKGTLDL